MESKLTFEGALEQLEGVVKALEAGDLPLEEAVKKYQEGTRLANHCRTLINNAESVIVKLMKGDGPEDFTETEE